MEGLWRYEIGASVVYLAAGIYVRAIGLVKELAWEGVVLVIY